MSSSWGKQIRLSIFGESHAPAIGMVLDGFPAGFEIDFEELSAFTARRTSRDDSISTPRKEADAPEFLCGLLGNRTCGTPICAVIRNRDVRSADYSLFASTARPGHADYTGFLRYHGYNDVRGGGHFSARLTAPLVLAGGICRQYLAQKGILIGAHVASLAGISDKPFSPLGEPPEKLLAPGGKILPVADDEQGEKMRQAILDAKQDGDSVGGVVECMVTGLPGGWGDPLFDSVESTFSSLLFSIPAVKGVEFGNGFSAAGLRGSQNNDPYRMENGRVVTVSNNHGGILGGITSGMPLLFRVALKPTPTIGKEQETVDFIHLKNTAVRGTGRHDPCIVPRAVVCVESAAAVALMDIFLSSRIWEAGE